MPLPLGCAYLRREPETLAASHERLDYLPCALNPDAPYSGDIAAFALAHEKDRTNSAFFLCDGERLVNRLKRDIFLRGASLAAILASAFAVHRTP